MRLLIFACTVLLSFLFFSCSVDDANLPDDDVVGTVKTDDVNEDPDENETVQDSNNEVQDNNQTQPDNNQTVDNESADNNNVKNDENDQTDDHEPTNDDNGTVDNENPDIDEVEDPVFINEDFEDENSWKLWKTVNINLLMNSADPFLYTGDLWEIGAPASTGKVETAHSGDNVLATILDSTIPDNKNLINVIYYNKKFTIPPEGLDVELYAFTDTHIYPNDAHRGGVLLYLCEDINFQNGGKCSKVIGDPANTVELVTDLSSYPTGFIDDFYGLYTSEYLGITGKSADYVKITGSVKSDTSSGKSVYLVIEYVTPNDSGTNVYGMYIDDIKVQKKDQ
jgi:hypothetical protein